MDVGRRVAEIRKGQGLTQKLLSERAGVSQSTISDIESTNRDIAISILSKICGALSVTLSDFFNSNDSTASAPELTCNNPFYGLTHSQIRLVTQLIDQIRYSNNKNEEAYLPLQGYAAAGIPLFAPSTDDTLISVPNKFLDSSRFFIIQAKGESMLPKIKDGDYVIVQKDLTPAQGEMALVLLDGPGQEEYTIKFFNRRNGDVVLNSLNPAFSSLIYKSSAVKSVEKVVYIIQK